MAKPTKETIPNLLVRNVPREIIMGSFQKTDNKAR